jgi:hypothetical protein
LRDSPTKEENMSSSVIKSEPVLVSGYPYLVAARNQREIPFDKEEAYPRFAVEVGRGVGRVVVEMRTDRYVCSSWDEATGTDSKVWSGWRTWAGDIRTAGENDRGEGHAPGIGDKTRAEINEALRPAVMDWLESAEYREARERAAARAVVGVIEPAPSYRIDAGRRLLEQVTASGELGTVRARQIADALKILEQAIALTAAACREPEEVATA